MKLPRGYRLAGVACGLKTDATKLDLGLVASDRACTAAGLYTTNQVVAAPVQLDRQRTPSATIRALVVNSGNANACTGDDGWRAALSMTEYVGEQLRVRPDDVLVMSTGIIGHQLDMAKVHHGIRLAATRLSDDVQACEQFARAIMTTDTVPKYASRQCGRGWAPCHAHWFCERGRHDFARDGDHAGPGDDGRPFEARSSDRLATRLPRMCRSMPSRWMVTPVRTTRCCCWPMAPSDAAVTHGEATASAFQDALTSLCTELAQSIVRDGEGATHFVEIRVAGAYFRRLRAGDGAQPSPTRRSSRRPSRAMIRTGAESFRRQAMRVSCSILSRRHSV